jgi:uncharacterized SAM-binding protein YcdF (DUF218 family)
MNEILRNYILALISPTAWIGILLILGTFLLWTKKQKVAKIFLTLGVSLFVLFSFDPIVEALLNQLENKYPGFEISQLKATDKIKYVVVLAGGYIESPNTHPLSTKLGKSTNIRVIEGIKIHREIPGSKMVFTGKGWAEMTEAQAMKNFAISLGVKAEDIVLENESTNTIDHTVYLKDILKADQFVLVTSALHMPRSMGLFLKAGYKPIPAPTGHLLTGQYAFFNMKVALPTGDNLHASDLLFYEFASTILAMMKGKL